jgi:hypothetical protein
MKKNVSVCRNELSIANNKESFAVRFSGSDNEITGNAAPHSLKVRPAVRWAIHVLPADSRLLMIVFSELNGLFSLVVQGGMATDNGIKNEGLRFIFSCYCAVPGSGLFAVTIWWFMLRSA